MKCKDCPFWSEMMAKSIGGIVFAMCENKESTNFTKYKAANYTCKEESK